MANVQVAIIQKVFEADFKLMAMLAVNAWLFLAPVHNQPCKVLVSLLQLEN
eukprot:GAHX01008919.1.p2 GENE.GAHX01008919.1~~GAHX01008919.1.p2  ORF type:complete len:51 (+),score=5.33 GAHX01008919.1:141-293(+)